MVISYEDFKGIIGLVVIAKNPKRGRILYESKKAPYDGIPRKIKDYHGLEWNSETRSFVPLVSFEGISGVFPFSDFEVVEKAS